ncbi:MAG: malonate-semialdehyde dehydrogenase (acetylating)/methylmalonate-semialdehyde dehydrogenase [Candidatus Marinamargulisbacteria bacterium]|jgi:malonate-semialdehyde dehydrogenase (acetylating)/methylmalonate-semialdehyde dehydrogenase
MVTSEITRERQVREIHSPIDGRGLCQISFDSIEDLDSKVKFAKEAQKAWAAKTLKQRVQVFYNYRNILAKHREDLAKLIHRENGKTMGESMAEVDKAIEVTEFACSLSNFSIDEALEVSQGIDCKMSRKPMGVVASIAPFNFPMMVPHWTIPIAITLGNAMILKPSEKVPMTAMRFAELLLEAGLPEGIFQLVQGGQSITEAICDHPDIPAVSFVGSTAVAEKVYRRVTGNLKRAICLGGAKNHLLVLPDADEDMTANDIVASMSGCAGQRCMAASVMIAVGNQDAIIEKIIERAKTLVCGENLGAVITHDSRERIKYFIAQAELEGAKILLDGREVGCEKHEKGYYIGPTIIDHVTPEMKVAQQEIFGPVLSIIRVETVDEAIAVENDNFYGNGASVYTTSGGMAQRVLSELEAGMVGVNIGVPVPREPFSFGGWNDSKFGVGDITGTSSVNFWTKLKKTTTKWEAKYKKDWMS